MSRVPARSRLGHVAAECGQTDIARLTNTPVRRRWPIVDRLDDELHRLTRAHAVHESGVEDPEVGWRYRTEKDGRFRELDRKGVFASDDTAVGDATIDSAFVRGRDVLTHGIGFNEVVRAHYVGAHGAQVAIVLRGRFYDCSTFPIATRFGTPKSNPAPDTVTV